MAKNLHRLSEIDPKRRTGVCKECGPVRISAIDSRYWRCVNARDALAKRYYTPRPKRPPKPKKPKGPGKTKQQVLHTKAREVIVPSQLGLCAICDEMCDLVIDHCHHTGLIRGALCSECNFGLGFFGDDPELLRRALAYLNKPPVWSYLGRSISPPSRTHRSGT